MSLNVSIFTTLKCLVAYISTTSTSLFFVDQTIQEGSGAVGIAQCNKDEIALKFAKLQLNICKKLREKPSIIGDLRTFFRQRFSHKNCIPETSTCSLNEIFDAITCHKLWDYWNYQPLEDTVQQFADDDQELKQLIEAYKEDLKSYSVVKKLIDDPGIISRINAYKPPSEEKQHEQPAEYEQQYYQKLSWKSNMKFSKHTLKYIADLWKKYNFVDLCSLPPYVDLLDYWASIPSTHNSSNS